MRILAFAYLVLIYLSFANCQQAPPNPSWVKQAAATKYTQCFQQLTPPTCSTGNSATCTTAYNNYISCLACSSSNSNLSSLKTCYKTCGTAFMADQTIQNDSSVTLYVLQELNKASGTTIADKKRSDAKVTLFFLLKQQ
ncbi:hypothetical protein ABPG73_006474 [Tetrahymena malaccensis]